MLYCLITHLQESKISFSVLSVRKNRDLVSLGKRAACFQGASVGLALG